MSFGNLSPRQKKILVALLGAGGLALLVLLGRRAGAATSAAAPSAGDLGATSGIPTFADNGGQSAGLSTDVTSALGDVATALDQLPNLVGTEVSSQLSGVLSQVPASPSADDIAAATAAAVGPLVMASNQSGPQNSSVVKAAVSAAKTIVPTTAQAKAIAQPNVSLNTNAASARAGLAFQTVIKDSKVYRYFESKPGKADYGETKDSKIYIRPASSK